MNYYIEFNIHCWWCLYGLLDDLILKWFISEVYLLKSNDIYFVITSFDLNVSDFIKMCNDLVNEHVEYNDNIISNVEKITSD